ncbi:hypothetical protein [Paenibacillus macerans]|uniref:hypothetical protein n=1 Tax=Paenibacillus macerans TaxID=44252 RepID=UPI00203F6944|nr:hypothetical protein [Paenibacillus macerans]MCM3702582.1 hypothetical protein [Paenibacillus macerans]
MSLNLERVLVVDGYFCDDPLDYDLHRAWLIRDGLALYFSGTISFYAWSSAIQIP